MTKKRHQLRRPLSPIEKARGKTFVRSSEPRVRGEDVKLVPGKGTKKTGGTHGGLYWHIFHTTERVGRVYINLVGDEDHQRPEITVEISAKYRGIGIGTFAFKRACELSGYDEVYASVRKSNIASLNALNRAGFNDVENYTGSGLLLVWRKDK